MFETSDHIKSNFGIIFRFRSRAYVDGPFAMMQCTDLTLLKRFNYIAKGSYNGASQQWCTSFFDLYNFISSSVCKKTSVTFNMVKDRA